MNIVCFDELSVATTGHFDSSAAAIVAVATLALYSSSPMGLIQVLFLTCITTPPIMAKMVKAYKFNYYETLQSSTRLQLVSGWLKLGQNIARDNHCVEWNYYHGV